VAAWQLACRDRGSFLKHRTIVAVPLFLASLNPGFLASLIWSLRIEAGHDVSFISPNYDYHSSPPLLIDGGPFLHPLMLFDYRFLLVSSLSSFSQHQPYGQR
jgi:hypothetical protein